MLIVSKKFSGLDKDIKINYLENNWDLDDKYFNLNYILRLENIKEIEKIEKKYNNLLSSLNLKNNKVDYISLLGKHNIRNYLNTIKDAINNLKFKFNTRYEEVLNTRLNLVSNITTCYFNDSDYQKPEYDNHSSLTGRTKVTSGLNFLVMKKSDRKNLTSKFKNGRIYEIDIVSLEPRIMCKLTRNEEYHDIYDHVLKNVIKESCNRKNVKLGLISTLYGAKPETVKKLSGLSRTSVTLIREWFQVEQLLKKLQNDYEKKDRLTNFYGRNIYSNNAMINHYIQSSSVDSAMIGFDDFCNTHKEGVNLIAIIHDAIIVDVHPDQFKNIENTYSVYDHILDIKLPVKIERLS
jgi:hypothetical protein